MASNRFFFCVFFIFIISVCKTQTSPFLDSLLKDGMPAFSKLLHAPHKYKLQVIYTKIDRDKNNEPHFTDYTFNVSDNYFYPASTVKLPLSILALVKLEELNVPGLNRNTTMVSDSAFFCQKKISADSTSGGSWPNVENYIKRMFLVSDNVAFTRTYEFVGFDYAHITLDKIGFNNIRLLNRLDAQCPGDTAAITPPVHFLGQNKDTVYKQPISFGSMKLSHPVKNSLAGSAHLNRQGKKINAPRDFSRHNYLHVSDLHAMMKRLIFNDYYNPNEKFPMNNNNRLFMIRQLGMYPRESDYPKYNPKFFYDSYKKYFLFGGAVATIKQDSVRMMNIVGRAYGFLSDCAYIVDFKNGIEFLLTGIIYVNEKDVIGNGKYEYESVGLPFLKNLGRTIYQYERKRRKENRPDLGEMEKLFKGDRRNN